MVAEDVAVAKAWLAIREDAIVGAEQRGDVLFHGEHELYSNKFIPAGYQSCPFESIKRRAKLIVKSCTACATCFARIVCASPNGTNEKNYIQLATGVCNDRKVECPSDDVGLRFKFEAAFEILYKYPKFIMALDMDCGKCSKSNDGNTKPQSSESSHFNQEDDSVEKRRSSWKRKWITRLVGAKQKHLSLATT